jgi:hypothetical protein
MQIPSPFSPPPFIHVQIRETMTTLELEVVNLHDLGPALAWSCVFEATLGSANPVLTRAEAVSGPVGIEASPGSKAVRCPPPSPALLPRIPKVRGDEGRVGQNVIFNLFRLLKCEL